jgi:hypothetical protein
VPEALISVYTSARRNRVYHGDHRCPNRPDEWVPKSLLWLADDPHDWRECRICGGKDDNSGTDWSYQEALADADTWDDLSLDGGGESA